MTRSASSLGVAALLACAGAVPASAADSATGVKISATITAGQVRQAKPVGSLQSARGTFEEVVDAAGAKGVWTLSFSGMTGRVTEARVTATVKYPTGAVTTNDELCHPCTSPASGVIHFPRPLDADAFLTAVRHRHAQVVLYTAANATGEIAGTLEATGSASVPAPAPSSPLVTAQASASYANGTVRLTLVVGRGATAAVIISDRGKPTFSPAPIRLGPGTTRVVLRHHFSTHGYHYGVVNFEFAGSVRTMPISIVVP